MATIAVLTDLATIILVVVQTALSSPPPLSKNHTGTCLNVCFPSIDDTASDGFAEFKKHGGTDSKPASEVDIDCELKKKRTALRGVGGYQPGVNSKGSLSFKRRGVWKWRWRYIRLG
ncbi:hypothetical protein K457DRAFT_16361 [Linnemannia elongata AG-77]|uniref:Uncharacterized protein n=1 Tax=Linnemannia elongata AG-77 TaxID=1314771 RepID=A0A197K7E2_9FUNG|nr:hypothetical protein K457DRAFT_16361 [Linnemannia elongata AG-77]